MHFNGKNLESEMHFQVSFFSGFNILRMNTTLFFLDQILLLLVLNTTFARAQVFFSQSLLMRIQWTAPSIKTYIALPLSCMPCVWPLLDPNCLAILVLNCLACSHIGPIN